MLLPGENSTNDDFRASSLTHPQVMWGGGGHLSLAYSTIGEGPYLPQAFTVLDHLHLSPQSTVSSTMDPMAVWPSNPHTPTWLEVHILGISVALGVNTGLRQHRLRLQ